MKDVVRRRQKIDVPTLVQLQGARIDERMEAESFVRQAFLTAYAARVEHFLPELMALRNSSGHLLGVLGLRHPGSGPLFLEQYLELPVEQILAAAISSPIDRNDLMEVGNFAVGAAGGGRWLITALTAYLHAAGHGWAVFTCGPMLQNAFDRLGIKLVDLAAADPVHLSHEESLRWGSYYEHKPRVMAANVNQSYAVLSALFEKECVLSSLWLGALQAGRLAA